MPLFPTKEYGKVYPFIEIIFHDSLLRTCKQFRGVLMPGTSGMHAGTLQGIMW